VHGELAALESSESFRRAPGLIGLLRFLVEKELSGDGNSLKETTIGMELYQRDAGYDPKIDGIVRVNANRLRKRLNEHYAGQPSAVQIHLLPGSYRPIFNLTTNPATNLATNPVTLAKLPASEIHPVPKPQQGRSPLFRPGWAVAVSLLIVAGALLWRQYELSRKWYGHSISRMSGVQQFPDFSPDSRRIAYAVFHEGTNTSSIYLQQVDGAPAVRLTNADRYENRPVWSPDGSTIAFIVRNPDHTIHVELRSLADGVEREIFARPSNAPWLCDNPKLSWTPDGKEIVTTAPPQPDDPAAILINSHACGIVAVNVRTRAVRRITHSPAGTQGDLEPAISPDGRTVAFLRQQSYALEDIYRVDIDGAHEEPLPFNREDILGVSWTPDGRSLLLCDRFDAGRHRILRLELAGGRTSVLESGAASAAFATMSRNGHMIAFTEYHASNRMLSLHNGAQRTLFNDSDLRMHTAVSPDGKSLAYSSDRTGNRQIWLSDSSGNNERQLTHVGGSGAEHPAWSADGQSLIFECRDHGISRICLQGVKQTTAIELVNLGADTTLPTPSADGRRLYFTSILTGIYEAWALPLQPGADGSIRTAGKPEQLTRGGAESIYESPSGKTLYIEGPKPAKQIFMIPAKDVPFETLPAGDGSRASGLKGNQDRELFMTQVGLVISYPQDGQYIFDLYRENDRTPTQFLPPQHLANPAEFVWNTSQQTLLMTTQPAQIGNLIVLSRP
jgi:Tol biopolymer transport system component